MSASSNEENLANFKFWDTRTVVPQNAGSDCLQMLFVFNTLFDRLKLDRLPPEKLFRCADLVFNNQGRKRIFCALL
jgi:hypothetical protein